MAQPALVTDALTWLKFLENFQKEEVYIEEFATQELALKQELSFRSFTTSFKKYVNNPRYSKPFEILYHLELKRVRTKLYFIYHTDTIIIHSGKFAKHNITLARLGYPRIQNA